MTTLKLSILMIEDSRDADHVKILLNGARNSHYVIVHVQHLADGLQCLRDQTFDAVLLDLELPGIDGIEAVRAVRSECPDVPLIALTDLDDEEVGMKMLQMDVQDYLTKGQIDSHILARSIRYARERKRVITDLQASESRFRRLSESGIIGIAYFDINGRIGNANDTLLSMIGYSREELEQGLVRWDRLLPPEWRPHMLKIARTFTETGRIAPYETEYLGRDGSRHWGLFGAAKIEGKGDGIAFVVDITERKKLAEELRRMAYHDVLTGLPNRRHFLELIRATLADAQRTRSRTALILLDLDRFKGVNDTLGHDAGDELLKLAAGRLLSALGSRGTVARIGGDEFSIVLPDSGDPEEIIGTVRKIHAALRETCFIAGREFHITTSMGISVSPDDGDAVNTLFRCADVALYRAKDRGRNTYEFYSGG